MPEDFATFLRRLMDRSTPGPWDNLNGTIRVVVNDDLCCPVFESRTPAELGKGRSYDARFADAWKQEHANAALIVTLVNAAPAIRELVEAAKVAVNRPVPDLVAISGGGHRTANLQDIIEHDNQARERLSAALSKLNEATS